MTEYDLDKRLVSNIAISDEMRSRLIKDVTKGKRTGNKSFRYSSAIMALIIIGIAGLSTVSVSAAYLSYKNRLEEMPREEAEVYETKLANDTFESEAEACTREFTKAEQEKLVRLEKEYYEHGVFPKENMLYLKTLSELEDGMLAYVEEDNMVHFPEEELTDEQMLQYIDHLAKYIYTIEQNAEAMADEEAEIPDDISEDALDLFGFDVAPEDEELLKEQSLKMIQEFYGEGPDQNWSCRVDGVNFSVLGGVDEKWDGYSVFWEESEAPNAAFYQLQIPLQKDGLLIISRGGLKVYMDCEEFSWEEAQEYLEQGENEVKKFMKERFGMGEPDSIEYGGFENADDEPVKSEYINYTLYYGEDHVSVEWLISTGEINGIAGTGILK